MVFYGLSPNQAWRNTRFSPAEMNDPSISGDAADPDRDGVSNLLEYVFSRDPRLPESSPAMTVSVSRVGDSYSLVLSYSHNRNATDVAVTYETSTDLTTWAAAPAAVIGYVVTSSETEQVTVQWPASAIPYFARLSALIMRP